MPEEKKMTGYPSVDKPWLKYYSEVKSDDSVPKMTTFEYIYSKNKDYLSSIAIKYYGKCISYGRLFNEVSACSKALSSLGLKAGDIINLCVSSAPEVFALLLACSKTGIIANFINPLFTTEQISDRINDTAAENLFVLDKMLSFVKDAISNTCIKRIIVIPVAQSMPAFLRTIIKIKGSPALYFASKEIIRWSDFMKAGENASEPEPNKDFNAPVLMVYSSGSTGASKGIVLTNKGINATISHYDSPDFPYTRGDTFLQMIPVWFSTGIIVSSLMPLSLGLTVIPELVFSKENFVRDLRKYHPAMTLTATSLWMYAIHSKELRNVNLSNMKYPATGGERLTDKDEADINTFIKARGSNSCVIFGYGMCELGGTVTSTSLYSAKSGSAGFPVARTVVAAFDEDTGREVKYYERGEIRVLSPIRMKEYYKNSEATKEFFVKDETGNKWGCTGDIGYIDEDGFVFILGRKTDSFINENGHRIYLFDIDEKVISCDNVKRCKAVNISEENTQKIAINLVLKDTANEGDTLNKIYDICRKELTPEQMPSYYCCRKDLPVHPSGKLDIEKLREANDYLSLNYALFKAP